MSKKHRHTHKQEKTTAYCYVNQYDCPIVAKIVAEYLNKLVRYNPDIYFINPKRPVNSTVTEVVVIGDASKIDEHYWYSISEAFFEGLQYEL